ncbi:MAG: hypothetical protein V4649_19665, partial [Bacteroidota bacterium]
CAGQQICLDIVAEDQQNLAATPAPILADTTDLTWNNPGQFSPVMANATWVRTYVLAQRGIQGPKADSFKFCWTPPVAAARTQPHSFTVKGVDRFCPIPAAAIRGINITVVAIPIPIITVIDKKCGFRDFSFVLANPAQTSLNTSQTQWQMETTPGGGFFTNMNSQSLTNYKFTQGGTYKYRLRLNSVLPSPSGCPSLDSGFIVNPEPLDVSVANTYNCIGSPANITAHASGGNRLANIAFYEFFLGGINSQSHIKGLAIGANREADSTLSVSPTNVGNSTQYKVKIGDWDNCVDSTTFSVLTRALPLKELTPKIRLCEGDDTSFFVGNNGSVSVQKAYWYIAPNLTLVRDSQLTYPITDVKFSDSATYVLKKIDVYGCTVLDTTQLLINSPVSFVTPKDSACNNDPVFPFQAKLSSMYIDSFVWYSIDGNTRYEENDTFLQPTTVVGTQQYLVRGYNTYDGKQCYKDDTATFKVNGLPVITNRPQAVPLCQDQGLYNLGSVQTTNPPTAQTSQVWTYPPNVNAFPNASNKSLISIDSLKYLPTPTNWAGKAFGNYAYITVTATTTGCIRRDSALLGIFPVSPVNINPPPKFCDFDANYSLYNLTRTINGSAIDEEWQGNGVTYNASINRWFFNPADTPNIVGGTNVGGTVNAGLSSPSDTNILSYIFTRRFAASVQVAFSPTRTGVVTMGSPVNGCPSSDTVLFRVTKSPKLKAGSLPTVCVGKDSMYLTTSAFAGTNSTTAANPATSYWYFAAPNKNLRAIARGQVFMPFHPDIVVAKDQSKVYQVIYADTATGCRAADTTNLTVKGLPTVDIVTANIKDSAVCLTRDSLRLVLTPNPLFLSSGSDSMSLTGGGAGLTADYGRDGGMFRFVGNSIQEQVYKLQYYYRTPEGCSGKDSFNVRIQYPPKVNLGPDAAACEYGAEFTINVVDPPSKFSIYPYGLAWEVVNQSGTIVKQTTDSLIYRASQTEINNGLVQVRVVTTDPKGINLCPIPGADTAIFTIYKKPVADFSGIDSGCVRTHAPFTSLNVNYTAVPSGVPGSNYIWYVNDAEVIDSLEKVNFSTSFATPGSYKTKLVVVNKTTTCSDTSDVKTSTAWLTPVADFEP